MEQSRSEVHIIVARSAGADGPDPVEVLQRLGPQARIAVVEDGKIIALDTPDHLIDQLLATGFRPEKRVREATLDDVFLNLTGRDLRD